MIKKLFRRRNRKKRTKLACKDFNYTELLLILVSAVNGCVSISAFSSFVGIAIGFVSSALRLTICAKTVAIRNYESIINENRRKNDEIVL